MTDMKEAMKEAQAHATLVRRAERDCQKQIDAAIFRAHAARDRKIRESRKALSPAAARIVVAAETEPAPSGTCEVRSLQNHGVVVKHDGTGAYTVEHDPNPAPAWLNQEPPPVPPGGVIEVEHKPRRRA